MQKEKYLRTWKKCATVALATSMILAPVTSAVSTFAASPTVAQSVTFATKEKTKVLIVGKTYNLAATLAPKTSKEKVTYTSSDKSIAIVGLTKGKVTPKKNGKVTITAKTTSGKKKSIEFLVVNKAGSTPFQASVNRMLAADNVTKITIKNPKGSYGYKIKEGDYSKKTLVVNAPNSDVTNSGNFESINIVDVKDGTFIENGKNNKFTISDKAFSFIATAKSIINSLHITGENAKANIEVNGTLKELALNTKVELAVTGKSKIAELVVGKGAVGSKIEISIPTKVSAKTTVNITFKAGSEGSTIEKGDASVSVDIKNETKENITIGTEGSDITETVVPSEGNNNNNNNNNPNEGTNQNPDNGGSSTKTANATVEKSEDGKTATFTLPTDIKNVKSAVVSVKGGNQYYIGSDILSFIMNALNNESTYVNRWNDITKFVYNGIELTGTKGNPKKEVTFENVTYYVTLSVDAENAPFVMVEKAAGSDRYTLTKTGNKKLTISASTNTTVADMVTFTVTY